MNFVSLQVKLKLKLGSVFPKISFKIIKTLTWSYLPGSLSEALPEGSFNLKKVVS
jgi:hypothetical protein